MSRDFVEEYHRITDSGRCRFARMRGAGGNPQRDVVD